MDCTRLAARSQMRFFRDSDQATPIVWYRVPWTRPALGVVTLFCSSAWDEDKRIQPPIGELNSGKQWWEGAPPPFLPIGPPGRCGTGEQWANGCLTTDPVPATDPNTGAPVCCGQGAILANAGMTEGPLAVNFWGAQFAVGIAPAGTMYGDILTACCPNAIPVRLEALTFDGGSAPPGWAGQNFFITYDAGSGRWKGNWTGGGGEHETLQFYCDGVVWKMLVTGDLPSSIVPAAFGSCSVPFFFQDFISVLFPAGGGLFFGVTFQIRTPRLTAWSAAWSVGIAPSTIWNTPTDWVAAWSVGIRPAGTFTLPPAWSAAWSVGIRPAGTFTLPPAWSAAWSVGIRPAGTFF